MGETGRRVKELQVKGFSQTVRLRKKPQAFQGCSQTDSADEGVQIAQVIEIRVTTFHLPTEGGSSNAVP